MTRMRSTVPVAVALVIALAVGFLAGAVSDEVALDPSLVTSAQQLLGLEFTPAERDSMMDDLGDYLENYGGIRGVEIDNGVPPAVVFNLLPVGFEVPSGPDEKIVLSGPSRTTERPQNLESLAFWSVRDIAELIRTRQVSSTELTQMYLDRLVKYSSELECVITLTAELAMEQARRADAEIRDGRYRGPLHGIPYGAKDLLAVPGYPTTWGAEPYREQVREETATVVHRLEEAGAVLVAKLTLGALAWGDVWYGGKTRNPWNLEQGSSGSSAGSASATAAGLVAFAIGTETWGSIVSPSTRCGTTGLRPTYGRVSRHGAMALSWTMDKIGPICRTVEDCAIVFDAIRGSDGLDQSVMDAPFNYRPDVDLAKLRIGYLESAFEEDYPNRDFDQATLEVLRGMGAELVPVELPALPVSALPLILSVEAAAAFDDLTRSNRDDLMVRQIKNAWPNVFRGARMVPAVEYIQANRVRYMIMQEMQKLNVDMWVSPSFGGDNLLLTNLTGHPCVVLPNGFREDGTPVSITFMGGLFDEETVLAVAGAYQRATDFHERHPDRYQATP